MTSSWRLILVLVASTAVTFEVALPARAEHTSEHVLDQISEVVGQAEADIDEVVSGFAAHIETLSEGDEVAQSAEEATAAVEVAWTSARSAVDNLIKLFPGQVGKVGGDAKQQLQQARQAARSTISELEDAWVAPIPAPPSTTTTVSPANEPAPAVGGPGPGGENDARPGPSGNGSGPKPGNGNGPPNNPGNGEDPRPSPGNSPKTGQVDGPPVEHLAALAEDLPAPSQPAADEGEMPFELAATTPDQPFTVSSEAITTLLAAEDIGATAEMAAMLATVLSPAVVDLVLSPLLILEILLRTLVDGGLRLIGPLTLLVVSALAIFGYDRRSKRNQFPEPV